MIRNFFNCTFYVLFKSEALERRKTSWNRTLHLLDEKADGNRVAHGRYDVGLLDSPSSMATASARAMLE